MKYVQFQEDKKTICAVFGCKQDDKNHPNLVELDDDDQRLVDFYARFSPVENGAPISLGAHQQNSIRYVDSYTQSARQRIAGTSDPIEVAAWSNKLRIAQAILSNGAIDSEVAAFQAEISLRNISGETLESFCQKVLANAASYSMVCAVLDGLKRSTQDTINAAQTKEEIDAAIEQMKSDIKTKLGV